MTNLQEGGGSVSGALLRRVWLGLPIAAGGSVALLLSALVLLPQFLALRGDLKKLSELEELQRQASLLRAQLRATEQATEKAEAQQARLFEIVSGSGDLSTFMAIVDREAAAAGVQLDLFEPQAGPPPAAGAPPAGQAAAGAPAAPAPAPAPPPAAGVAPAPGAAAAAGAAPEIPGLLRQSILVSARGDYPALLAFLRRLERLNVLVVQTNFKLLLEPARGAPAAAGPPKPVLKMLLSLYSRPGGAPAATAPPAAGGGQPGAPAPAGSPPPSPPPPAPAPAR